MGPGASDAGVGRDGASQGHPGSGGGVEGSISGAAGASDDVHPSRSAGGIDMSQLRAIPDTLDGAPSRPFPVASDIEGVGLDGRPLAIRVSEAGGRWLFVFLSDDCIGCQPFWDELGSWRSPGDRGLPVDVRPVIVTKGPAKVAADRIRTLIPVDCVVPVVLSDDAWESYQVLGYPDAVVVGSVIEGDGQGGGPDGEDVPLRGSGAIKAGGASSHGRSRVRSGEPDALERPQMVVLAKGAVFERDDVVRLVGT